MDFSAIFQLRTKKFWWMDVIFYFVISLLIATVFCYFIFSIKNNIQRKDIQTETSALQTVGTDQQKEQEKEVINYQLKISDFSNLLKNHEFASNLFSFMEAQTMPNVWFKQFSLDKKNNAVQLSGVADSMDAFSRQIAAFETNKYVKSVGNLNSLLGSSAKINFNVNLVLDQSIFSYISNVSTVSGVSVPAEQQSQNSSSATAVPASNAEVTENTTPTTPANSTAVNSSAAGQQVSKIKDNEKLITSFHLLLNPEVVGLVDETNYKITLNVPYGTDIKNLTSSIVISPEATVSPASNVSQDFTSPVIYRVTAEDGSVQGYDVRVVVSAPSVAAKKSLQPIYKILIIIASAVVSVVIITLAFLFFWKRSRVKKVKS